MKKRLKKILISIFVFSFICLISLTAKNNISASSNSSVPSISINQFHATWTDEFNDLYLAGVRFGSYPFVSNGLTFDTFQYNSITNNNVVTISFYYDDLLVYSNGWLDQNYRVVSFTDSSAFTSSVENFVDYYYTFTNTIPYTNGYNIPISLNNVYYRFTNANPINNTGNNRIFLDFYTTYFIPYEWQDTSGSFSEFEQPRNFWNNLYITSSSIDYCYSFNSEYGLETTSFLLLNNNEWSQNGGKGIPQDQVIRIADTNVDYETYVFLVYNGYFGTYTELIYTPNDPSSFGALVKSIANTPIEILQSILDVNMLGVNLFSVFCGIITIFLVVFVIKRIT